MMSFRLWWFAALLFAVIGIAEAHAGPIASQDIHIVDGNTIEVHGQRIRLMGFDAPELGRHAHCGIERMLAARATSRLRRIIRTGDDIDLQSVDCSCRLGAEGTRWCNHGHACGYLSEVRRGGGASRESRAVPVEIPWQKYRMGNYLRPIPEW